MAAMGGGVRRYLARRGVPDRKRLALRSLSIVNMRAVAGLQDTKKLLEDVRRNRWGNDFSYYIIPLDCAPAARYAGNPLARVVSAHRTMAFIKASPEAHLIKALNKNLVYRPLGGRVLVAFNEHNLDRLHTFMSNLVAPQFPLRFAGSPLRRLYNCTGPPEFGFTLSFLSYNGEVTCCCSCDSNKVPDPDVLVADVVAEFEHLKRAAAEQTARELGVSVEMVQI